MSNRIKLAFASHLLNEIRSTEVAHGIVVTRGAVLRRVNITKVLTRVKKAITAIRQWDKQSDASPKLLLNRHCPDCQFRDICREQAIEEDDLSLLDGICTEKQIARYQRKGIFTVNQLSYTYRPRKQRKRSRHVRQPRHSFELQALAIRTGKVYLQTIPHLERSTTELFLDIEGIPDGREFYLMGIVVRADRKSKYICIWSTRPDDEKTMWRSFVAFIKEQAESTLYHYGSYDRKALEVLEKRYPDVPLGGKLTYVNVIDHIFGKIYFPTYSNGLKAIGQYLGARWSGSLIAGSDAIAWRNKWLKNADDDAKQQLIQYNKEDCLALTQVVDFLMAAESDHRTLVDVDFLFQQKKSYDSPVRNAIHQHLEAILKLAHASNYEKSRIAFKDSGQRRTTSATKRQQTKTRKTKKKWRITRTIEYSHPATCPTCAEPLICSRRKSQRVQADLRFTRNGVHKSVVKQLGYDGKCRQCNRYVRPDLFRRTGRPQKYGYGFKAWVAYLRVATRLSYGCIRVLVRDTFGAALSEN